MKRNVILGLVGLLAVSWLAAVNDMVSIPKKIKEHIEKAQIFEEKQIYVDAVDEYQGALEYDKGNVELSLKMAEDYLAYGEDSKFISTCQSVAEANQSDTSALNTLMEYYKDNAQEDRAVRYLKSFTKSYPENENAQKWMKKLQGTYSRIYCQYAQLSGLYNDSMVVEEETDSGVLYGVADAEGRELAECKYKEAHPYSEDGYALVLRDNDTYAYVDRDGLARKAPDECYKDLGLLNDDRVPASKDGKYGFLDENMEETTDFSWDAVSSVSNRLAAAQKKGKWAIVNQNGKAKTDYQYDDVVMDENGICSNQSVFIVKEGKSYHIVSSKGKDIGKETFDDAKAFNKDGYAAVEKNGKWGFVDIDGKLVIDCQYDDALSFSSSYAAVKQDDAWGYIDMENTMAIEPGFALATLLSSEGTAAVKLVNEDGEIWQLIQLSIFE
ncbi:WG repeat-containing protein [Blautia sp.]|uniref:WG repeat-containing protein n=1 Tax=Blautia sp. TaxID=1955243 RepID=UPI00257D90A9|nr:WG repeat-containing protein [Blautia sp.]